MIIVKLSVLSIAFELFIKCYVLLYCMTSDVINSQLYFTIAQKLFDLLNVCLCN